MFAARYVPGKKELSIEDIPIPEPKETEVLLKVHAAGICHSDLHILHGEVPMPHSFTMGHEACGSVVKKGSAVLQDYKESDLYAVHGPNPCGRCSYCRTGYDNLCNSPDRAYVGIGQDGAYAEYLVVQARNIVKVPKGVPAEVAAVATDAVLTPYHAIKAMGKVRMASKVLMIGLGGLGLNGVQVGVALGAEVTATDLKAGNLEAAKKLGAQRVINAQDIGTLDPMSFDVIIDFVGSDKTFQSAQTLIRPGGKIVLVGLGSSHVSLATAPMITFQVEVLGSFWGTHQELEEIFDLISKGKIKPEVQTAPLKEVNHWLKELEAGHIKARIALLP